MFNNVTLDNQSFLTRITPTQIPPHPLILVHFNITVIWPFVNKHVQGVSVLSGNVTNHCSAMAQYIESLPKEGTTSVTTSVYQLIIDDT